MLKKRRENKKNSIYIYKVSEREGKRNVKRERLYNFFNHLCSLSDPSKSFLTSLELL